MKNLTGCKEAISLFNGKRPAKSVFQYSYILQFNCYSYLFRWVDSANSQTGSGQRKGMVCFLFTALCQELDMTLADIARKYPKISGLMCDYNFCLKIWNQFKESHTNPQTLRNQSGLLRELFRLLILNESDVGIATKLQVIINTLWDRECKFWSRKSNYYRRTQVTKSNLQQTRRFITGEEMKVLDETCREELDMIMNQQGKDL